MMAFVPTTLSGLLLFVVLLLPGFAYIVGRERHTTGQEFSAFRETAVVVAASVSSELIVLVIFAVTRVLLPSLTPDVGALVRDSGSYLRGEGAQSGHYGQVAIWATVMLAASVVLAYGATIPEVRGKIRAFATKGQKLPRTRQLISDAMGQYPHESSVSAWWMLFDTWAGDADVRVRCFVDDGSYVEGNLGTFSREADDKPERDLVLVQPISFRPSGDTDIHAYEEASAVCISAARIVTMFVTYSLSTQVIYPAASAAGAVAPAQASALAAQPSPSGPS
jgi:hypothetical protein